MLYKFYLFNALAREYNWVATFIYRSTFLLMHGEKLIVLETQTLVKYIEWLSFKLHQKCVNFSGAHACKPSSIHCAFVRVRPFYQPRWQKTYQSKLVPILPAVHAWNCWKARIRKRTLSHNWCRKLTEFEHREIAQICMQLIAEKGNSAETCLPWLLMSTIFNRTERL